jgi:hypothetical protein
MNKNLIPILPALPVAASAAFAPDVALAYLGPGAGLGMIGSLIAVVVVVLISVLGLVIYPLRMLRKRRTRTK